MEDRKKEDQKEQWSENAGPKQTNDCSLKLC